MQSTKTIFVVEIVSCFLDVFFKSPKFTSSSHGPKTIAVFWSNYKRGRVRIRAIYKRVERIKQILREGWGNVRHKTLGKNERKRAKFSVAFLTLPLQNPKLHTYYPPNNCIISVENTLGQSRSLLGRAWVPFREICPSQFHLPNL